MCSTALSSVNFRELAAGREVFCVFLGSPSSMVTCQTSPKVLHSRVLTRLGRNSIILNSTLERVDDVVGAICR